MTKWIDATYRLGTNAFHVDRYGNIITGEALMLALLLHTKKNKRTKKNEAEIAALLDDPNIDKPKK